MKSKMKDIVSLVKEKKSERLKREAEEKAAYDAKWNYLENEAKRLFSDFREATRNIRKLGFDGIQDKQVKSIWDRTITLRKNGKDFCKIWASTDYQRLYDSDGYESQEEGIRWAVLKLKFTNDAFVYKTFDNLKIDHLLEVIAEKIAK